MGIQSRMGNYGSFFLYWPDMEMHSPFRRYGLVILREGDDLVSVEELMARWHLAELAQEESLIIAFPNPPGDGWATGDKDWVIRHLRDIQERMCEPEDFVLEADDLGIPSLSSMLNRWHVMNDTHYYVALDGAVPWACALAREIPHEVAAVCCIAEEDTALTEQMEAIQMPLRWVHPGGLTSFPALYRAFCKPIRRLNTGNFGEPAPRLDFQKEGFDLYVNDTRLGDQEGLAHTWFVHVPLGTQGKRPLVIFLHGGSDSPAEAAEMSRFHKIGEREGFLTVYPWACNTAAWNCALNPAGQDDLAFLQALIVWMGEHYPVDRERIYMSGFSNGAAMAQTYVLAYPEQIAALCHIDSNWPGRRLGLSGVAAEQVPAYVMGMERKKEFDYLMPVWYTYGDREASFPVFHGCSQQVQYDFWKAYNHIPVVDTPPLEAPHPCGCGVPGDQCETLAPLPEYPDHTYQVNRFYTQDDQRLNLYNYVVMHSKGHEVAPGDALLAWRFVRQFRRYADGTLGIVPDETGADS